MEFRDSGVGWWSNQPGYGKLENVGEAFHAEIIACLQGIQRAADLGMQRMILETDASMVAQATKSTDYDRSSASGLIWEMKDLSPPLGPV